MRRNENSNKVMEIENHLKNRWNLAKKTFLLMAILCIYATNSFAQDIITLTNGEDIQALVQEIGEVDIKYKKFDNPKGPNYTMKKSEIFTIKYANGIKEVFTVIAASDPTTKQASSVVTTSEPATKENATPAPDNKQANVQYNKGLVYLNSWGTLKYVSDDKKVTNIEDLFYDMPEALKNYQSGNTWRTVGYVTIISGALVAGYDLFYHKKNFFSSNAHSSFSCPIYWTGMGLVIASEIFDLNGKSKMEEAVWLYNQRQQTSDISLNFGVTQSGGLGFTLNF